MKPFFFLTMVLAAMTSTADPLSLKNVITSTQSFYPLISAANQDTEIAKGELTASEGAFDLVWKNRAAFSNFGYYENTRMDSILEKPIAPLGASFFAGYRLGRGNFAVYDEKAMTLSDGEARIGFEVSLWRNRPIDRRRANLEKSRLGISIAEANAIQARVEAVRSASLRYWDWVAAGKKIQIYRELLSVAEARDKGLLERVKHGDIPEFERKDNERTILQRKSQLVSAERSLQQTGIELSFFLRDNSGNPVIPTEKELPSVLEHTSSLSLNSEEDLVRALKQRPELVRLTLSRDQSTVEADWADNQIAPRIDLQVATSRDFGSGLTTRSGTELETAILIEIPLERRLATGRQESARATALRIEANEKLMRDRIVADVRDAHSLLKAAVVRIDIAVAETELAKKLEQGERERFYQGDSHILFVNLREQATADARVREVDALADHEKALAQLKGAVADL